MYVVTLNYLNFTQRLIEFSHEINVKLDIWFGFKSADTRGTNFIPKKDISDLYNSIAQKVFPWINSEMILVIKYLIGFFWITTQEFETGSYKYKDRCQVS